MTDDRVEAIVRRLHDNHWCVHHDGNAHDPNTCTKWVIERAVRAGLELAAEVADDVEDVQAAGIMGSYYAQLGDARETRKAVVSAIRALAGKETP